MIDSSGNSLTGIGVRNPIYSASSASAPSAPASTPNAGSISFDGTSQRIFINDYPSLQLVHSMTLEAWIDTNTISAAEGVILFRGDDRGGLDPYKLEVINGGATAKFQITNASDQSASVSAPIVKNQWVHVAGTLDDATGSIKLYVNGALAASSTTTIRPLGTLDSSQTPGVAIGGLQSDNPALNKTYFNGLIDEVRISDTALTPSQFLVPEPVALPLLAFGGFTLCTRMGRRKAQRAFLD